MVYDWADKEDVCYQWYVVDRRSLDDLMKHMKSTYGFEPRYAPAQHTASTATAETTNHATGVTANGPIRRNSRYDLCAVCRALVRNSYDGNRGGNFQASRALQLTMPH